MSANAEKIVNVNLNLVLDQVAKDKGIERGVLVATLEDAMKTAAKKHFGQDRALEAKYDSDKGVVELFQAITVVAEITDPIQAVNQLTLDEARKKGMEVEPGDELVFQIFYRDEDAAEAKAQDDQYGDILKLRTFRRGFGRIAAQTAKQVILQRTRDAERENVYNEYKDRKNEVITGIARRFERGNIVVDLGRAEAVLPVREQVPRETYRPGDRVQAYVLDVLRESKGPQIILSRASVNLLDPIHVSAYGASMPINQLATVSVPEPRMLSVQVWYRTTVQAVDRAIREANLGLNPVTDGALIRLPIPALNAERRQELVKVAHKYAESARVAVRNVRRDGMELLKKLEKDGQMSEDDHRKNSAKVQELTDKLIKDVDQTLVTKEAEIKQV